MTADHLFEPGDTVVAGYRVIDLLQRGQDFDTYNVWSEERFTNCVLKTVRPESSSRQRLFNEGRILISLNHPHLIRGYELLTFPNPALITQTLGGDTLANLVETRGRLTAPDVAHIGSQLGSALRYLHSHGVLHLDVKPSNVVIGAGLATLIDLSLAQPPGRCAAGTGTADYLSPEQARGGAVDSAADVWGLGICLYVCATATNPFRPAADSNGALSLDRCPTCGIRRGYLQLTERPRPLGRLRRFPKSLSAAIDGCLAADPQDRPTLAEVHGAFTDLVGTSEPASHSVVSGRTPSGVRQTL